MIRAGALRPEYPAGLAECDALTLHLAQSAMPCIGEGCSAQARQDGKDLQNILYLC
jgi:hypothetical protein